MGVQQCVEVAVKLVCLKKNLSKNKFIMSSRSICASTEGIISIKKALKQKGWAKTYLADVVQCSRTTIHNLMNGKRIEADCFFEICSRLHLDPNEIAESTSNENLSIDEIVVKLREIVHPTIIQKCSTMKVLDMSHPIELTGDNGIYTNVNILEKITAKQRLEIEEILNLFLVEEINDNVRSMDRT